MGVPKASLFAAFRTWRGRRAAVNPFGTAKFVRGASPSSGCFECRALSSPAAFPRSQRAEGTCVPWWFNVIQNRRDRGADGGRITELNAACVELPDGLRPDTPPKPAKLLRRTLCPSIHHSMHWQHHRCSTTGSGACRYRSGKDEVAPGHAPLPNPTLPQRAQQIKVPQGCSTAGATHGDLAEIEPPEPSHYQGALE
jgi:hypothetical protein